MKVLQVNCVYKKGSTGKIIYDIHTELKKNGIESIVCYGRGQKEDEENVYKTSSEIIAKFNNLKSRLTGMQYSGSYLSTKKLINIIRNEKPDVVHLHCINGFFVNIYKLINYLKVNDIKTILTLHAEFMHTANCGHAFDCEKWKSGCGNCPNLRDATKSYILDKTNKSWRKMYDAFEGFNNLTVVSVSPWLESRARQSPILKEKNHVTVLNGIDTDNVFYPRNTKELRKKLELKDEKVILHVTSGFNSPIKGSKYVIELAKAMKDENIKLIIVGNTDKTITLPQNIIDIGVITNQHELAEYYSIADLTVVTSKRETFSMICAESLSCGTPVVGFKAGAPEQISLKEYSEFVEYGDIDGMLKVIYKYLGIKESISIQEIENKSKEVYSKKIMSYNYITHYKEIMNR